MFMVLPQRMVRKQMSQKRVPQKVKTNSSAINQKRPYEIITPAFPDCDHCIVFCTDDNYTALTAVAIQSIVNHLSKDEFYDILIFHGGLNSEHMEIYERQWENIKNLKLRFVNVAPVFDGLSLYTENRSNFSREAYFRLVTPWVLGEGYEKALYLDGDLILRGDVSPVFRTELGDKLLAGVRDYWGICNCYMDNDPRKSYRLSIGLDDIDNYIISATLLFNLKLWRDQFTLEQVIALCASRKWEQHDQDVVNILCQHKMVYLSPTWGMMEDYGNNHHLPETLLHELNEVKDPIVVHFGGIRKPYYKEYVEYDLEFWKCADETPYMTNLLCRIKSDEYRNYVVYSINGIRTDDITSCEEEDAFYKGVNLGKYHQGFQRIRVIRINNQVLHIEGAIGFFKRSKLKDVRIFLSVNGIRIDPALSYIETATASRLKNVTVGYSFVFDVPLSKSIKLYACKLVATVDGKHNPLSRIDYHYFSELPGTFANEYYSNDGWTVQTDGQAKGWIVSKNTILSSLKNEWRFLTEISKINDVIARKALVMRPFIHFIKLFLKKPIWLISDRMDRADDNGEVFYRYLKEYKKSEVSAYFLLLPSSKDYCRLKSLGGIVTPYSWKHKILSLMAEWSISSQTDYVYRDPFRDYGAYYRDMLRKTRFVFLQHGVIMTDLTRWLDKDIQEFDGFVTSTEKEYREVLTRPYHYTQKQVWLTGLPRFDRLCDKKEKVISIMPTWRKYLFTKQDTGTGIWGVIGGFANTEYVSFYRNLMNNEHLRKAAKKYGYRLQFVPHPTCRVHIDDFEIPEDVITVSSEQSYSEIYERSSLLVTDYSSSIIDFVYLRKPVVYCQFDFDVFFSGEHISDKGSFDYETDGYGEVTHTLEELINVVISYMENGCTLHEPYSTRIDLAFADRTPTHCEKLYQNIRSQGKY